MKKKIVWIIIISIFLIIFYLYKEINENKKKQSKIKDLKISEDILFNSNTFSDVNYSTKDAKGNEYIIKAKKGEVDYSDPNTIFLTDVYSIIRLTNSNNIEITSNFGKYNTVNFDTIFSKNVIVTYLENKINGEYLDFSIGRNSMIISKNVIYKNLDNILKADVVEIEVDTKNTKIFMHDIEKKVNIQSKEYGYNKKISN